MPKLTVEMTDAQLFALDMIAVDKQEWADNVLTERARVQIEALKPTADWMEALLAFGKTGDDEGVLLKGKEMGLFRTAAELQAEREAERTNAPAKE